MRMSVNVNVIGKVHTNILLHEHISILKKGKSAHVHTFFKIRAGGTAQLFDPNSEHEFFNDIFS